MCNKVDLMDKVENVSLVCTGNYLNSRYTDGGSWHCTSSDATHYHFEPLCETEVCWHADGPGQEWHNGGLSVSVYDDSFELPLVEHVQLPEYALNFGTFDNVAITEDVQLQMITEANEPTDDFYEYYKEEHHPRKIITITKMLITKSAIKLLTESSEPIW